MWEGVEIHPIPLHWPLAYTTACNTDTVEAMIFSRSVVVVVVVVDE